MSQRALNTRNNMTIMQWLTCLVSPLLVTNEPMLSTRKVSTPRVQKHRAEKQRRREKRLAERRPRNRSAAMRSAAAPPRMQPRRTSLRPPRPRRKRAAARPTQLSASRDAGALEATCRRVPRRRRLLAPRANDCPADRAHVAGADLRGREDHRAPAHELAEAATGVFIRHRRDPSLTPDSRREDVRIGFIGCGTKRCWGEAMFEYCEGPLDDARLAALQDAHCVRAPEGAAIPARPSGRPSNGKRSTRGIRGGAYEAFFKHFEGAIRGSTCMPRSPP